MQSQTQQMRCTACQHLFTTETPVHVSVESWVGFIKGIRCPACGTGPKNLTFGQSRSLPEDRSFERGTTYESRLSLWIANGETGNAALAIYHRLAGRGNQPTECVRDLGDVRRCLLLLDRMPEWRHRMDEMVSVSDDWARLCTIWSQLVATYLRECGADLSGYEAPKSRALLASVLDT